MHRMLVISLFHHVNSSSFCNRHYLFTLSFLSKQTRHGSNIVSFYFFLFICGRAKCLSRNQCVGSKCKRRRPVLEEQSASFSNCDQQLCTKLDDPCLWRDPRSRVLNSIQFICISISRFMHNKLQYTWCGDYCKRVRPAHLPVLTEVRGPSLWEQHPWYVPHRDRPGYNSPLAC
jgi:hypothetical protein